MVSIATGSCALPTACRMVGRTQNNWTPIDTFVYMHYKLVYNRHGNTVPYHCYEQCKQCRYISIYMAIEDVMVDMSE